MNRQFFFKRQRCRTNSPFIRYRSRRSAVAFVQKINRLVRFNVVCRSNIFDKSFSFSFYERFHIDLFTKSYVGNLCRKFIDDSISTIMFRQSKNISKFFNVFSTKFSFFQTPADLVSKLRVNVERFVEILCKFLANQTAICCNSSVTATTVGTTTCNDVIRSVNFCSFGFFSVDRIRFSSVDTFDLLFKSKWNNGL